MLPSNMSRTITGKVAPVHDPIFHLLSVVTNLIEQSKETDRITTFPGRFFFVRSQYDARPSPAMPSALSRLDSRRGVSHGKRTICCSQMVVDNMSLVFRLPFWPH